MLFENAEADEAAGDLACANLKPAGHGHSGSRGNRRPGLDIDRADGTQGSFP